MGKWAKIHEEKRKRMCVQLLRSCPTLRSWTVAQQAPLSMGSSRQESWSGLPFPPPGDLPDPGIEPASPVSPTLQADFFTPEPPGKPRKENTYSKHLCYRK